MNRLVLAERIEGRIFLVRGHKVMLDNDLAGLYGVSTKNLNKAVKRNLSRFPADFMFRLRRRECGPLRFQFGTSKIGRGGRRSAPYAFTEQGVAMLSSVLRSRRAVVVNIQIMRTFVRLRRLLWSQKDLVRKLDALQRKYEGHDTQIQGIFEAIRRLTAPPTRPAPKIGFQP